MLMETVEDKENANNVTTQKQQVAMQLVKKETGFRLHPERINRKGRPVETEKKMLRNALRWAGRKHGNKSFLHHISELAYEDKTVAMAVLNKLIPNAEAIRELVEEEKEANKIEVNIVYNNANSNVPDKVQRQDNQAVDIVAETEARFRESC